MDTFEVEIFLPPDNRSVVVELSQDLTPLDIMKELVAAKAIWPNPHGWMLAIRGGDFLRNEVSLKQSGVNSGQKLRLIPATDAG